MPQEHTVFVTGVGEREVFDQVHLVLSHRQILQLVKTAAQLLLEVNMFNKPRGAMTFHGATKAGDQRSPAVVHWMEEQQ
jgi:hypothetical protein